MKENKILEEVRSHRQDILNRAQEYGVKNVRLFGSVARGDADEKSDIDFLVDVEDWCSLFELGGLTMDLEAMFQRHVDVAVERGMKERIHDRVIKDVIPL